MALLEQRFSWFYLYISDGLTCVKALPGTVPTYITDLILLSCPVVNVNTVVPDFGVVHLRASLLYG